MFLRTEVMGMNRRSFNVVGKRDIPAKKLNSRILTIQHNFVCYKKKKKKKKKLKKGRGFLGVFRGRKLDDESVKRRGGGATSASEFDCEPQVYVDTKIFFHF